MIQTVNFVSSFSLPNHMGAKVPVHSKFNVPNWTHYLRDYPDKVVVDSLQFGWFLNFQGQFIPKSTFQNHHSAVRNPEVLRNYVEKELRLQCTIGLFPFDVPCVSSPLMCVPKRDSSDFRIIHDLSFPEYSSV